MESIFIEIICPKSSNIIVGCIYKHPSLQVNNITNDIILSLLGKLNMENSKKIFLPGDFNIDLLQYKTSEPVNNFVDTLSSNFLSLLILLPTRISNSSSTLIDNIFCNVTFNSNIISDNFTSTVSDHLPQFAITEDFFANSQRSKSNIFKRNWKNLDQNLFISDFENASCDEIIDVNKENVNLSINNYLYNIDLLLEKHAPLKRLNKQKLKFQQKPWITQGLQISIKKKNTLFSRYIKCKESSRKRDLHSKYKSYQNLLSTLLIKDSKQQCFNDFFKSNNNDITKTWKGIKSITSMKNISNND